MKLECLVLDGRQQGFAGIDPLPVDDSGTSHVVRPARVSRVGSHAARAWMMPCGWCGCPQSPRPGYCLDELARDGRVIERQHVGEASPLTRDVGVSHLDDEGCGFAEAGEICLGTGLFSGPGVELEVDDDVGRGPGLSEVAA